MPAGVAMPNKSTLTVVTAPMPTHVIDCCPSCQKRLFACILSFPHAVQFIQGVVDGRQFFYSFFRRFQKGISRFRVWV